MSYVFTIKKNGDAILHPDAIKLAPELAYLTKEEVLAIILAYDYYSQYRQHPEDERERRARAQVFGQDNEEFFRLPKIKKAVELYKSLQFDPRRNQIMTYKDKLRELDTVLTALNEDDLKKISEVIKSQKELRKAISEIEIEINQEEEDNFVETEDKTKLSFLEKLQSNKENYLKVINRKPAKVKVAE